MKKKLLAMLLIVCMMFGSSLTTFAAEGVSDNSTGKSTVSGSGDVSYVDTKVYKVTIPTNNAMNLVVDPQGLTGLQEGKDVSGADLSGNAGLITTTAPVYTANLSSVPMKISVQMCVSGNATAVTTETAVSTNTTTNILLYAVPSKVDTKGAEDAGYVPSTTGIVLQGEKTTVNFVLDAADYVFHKEGEAVTYKLKTDGESHGTAINFEGKVNTRADWSDFAKGTKKITWEAIFSFQPAGANEEAADGAPYGMMTYGGTKITLPEVQSVAPTFTTGSGIGVINYTKGTGDDGLQKIDKIEITNQSGQPYDGYKAYGGIWGDATDTGSVITFQSAYVNCYSNATEQATVTYITNGGATKTATVNVRMK